MRVVHLEEGGIHYMIDFSFLCRAGCVVGWWIVYDDNCRSC